MDGKHYEYEVKGGDNNTDNKDKKQFLVGFFELVSLSGLLNVFQGLSENNSKA